MPRMHLILLLAALALPVAAWAQHGQSPATPSTPEWTEAHGAPAMDEQELDELLALELDDVDFLADDDPGGDRQVIVRRTGPGGGRAGLHMRAGHRGMVMRFARLDLTDAQKAKMRDLHEAAMRKNIQRRADMQLAQMDLHKLMRADAPSAQSVNAQIDKIAKLRADGMKAHFETFLQARALLTPEQLKKFNEMPGSGAGPHGKSGMMMHGGPGMHH